MSKPKRISRAAVKRAMQERATERTKVVAAARDEGFRLGYEQGRATRTIPLLIESLIELMKTGPEGTVRASAILSSHEATLRAARDAINMHACRPNGGLLSQIGFASSTQALAILPVVGLNEIPWGVEVGDTLGYMTVAGGVYTRVVYKPPEGAIFAGWCLFSGGVLHKVGLEGYRWGLVVDDAYSVGQDVIDMMHEAANFGILLNPASRNQNSLSRSRRKSTNKRSVRRSRAWP